ncbi:AraC family transcriptional regulator [Brachybacterium sp. ACRRE]|uniref:helix-turn-helix domain-containing protein n=1 Tax=Brachybacterium sp. ACRRE TaxID=2918184 RepID=UPI001EF21709|nr:AraC family transcriptional regulator [Brachybacterium sp. ACRRE]MCG7308531.1 AraC family transcriptional regulator [Brachybacterium sp. ACRRE]
MGTDADRTKATPPHMYGHVLRPEELLDRACYDFARPCAALRPWVERYWSVRWDLAAGETFPVATLDDPSVNLTVERGGAQREGTDTTGTTEGAGVWITGPVTRGRFDVRLTGSGSVVGVKFALGGTRAFSTQDLRALRDRTIPAQQWFGGAAVQLVAEERTGTLPEDAVTAAPRLDAWLLERGPTEPPDAPMLRRLLQIIDESPTHSLADLERRSGVPARTLQRLFDRGLGVGVKRMLVRARVIDATAALDRGDPRSLSDIASALGWFDQSHFIRDFRAITGETPARYARRASG